MLQLFTTARCLRSAVSEALEFRGLDCKELTLYCINTVFKLGEYVKSEILGKYLQYSTGYYFKL